YPGIRAPLPLPTRRSSDLDSAAAAPPPAGSDRSVPARAEREHRPVAACRQRAVVAECRCRASDASGFHLDRGTGLRIADIIRFIRSFGIIGGFGVCVRFIFSGGLGVRFCRLVRIIRSGLVIVRLVFRVGGFVLFVTFVRSFIGGFAILVRVSCCSLVRLVCVRFCFRVGGFVLLVTFVCGFIGGFAILVRVSRCSLVRLVCVRFCFRVGGFVLLVAFVCGFIGGFAILVRVSRCSLVRLVCVRFCFRVGGFVLLATFVCGFIGVFAFLVRLILGGGLRRILQQRTAGVFLVRTDGGEPGDIGRNGFDLVIGQTAHDILHDFRQIAVVALAAAVGMQLFGSVFAELAGYARVAGGRVAHACRAMAAGTGRHPEFGQSATVDRRAL